MASNYGRMVAARRAAQNRKRREDEAERALKNADKPTRKRKAKPLDTWPMHDYEYAHTQDAIDWESETYAVSQELSERLCGEPNMQILVAGTGSGKTALALDAVGKLIESGQDLRPIIVAPRAVVEGKGWQETICSYNAAHKTQIEPYAITTYDKLANAVSDAKILKNMLSELDGRGFLVLDECHRLKNPTSKRSKQLQKLTSMRRLGLTATPLTNDIVLDTASYLIMAGYYRNKTDFMRQEDLTDLLDQYYRIAVYNRDGSVNEAIWPNYRSVREKLSHVLFQPTIANVDAEMPNLTSFTHHLEDNESLENDIRSLALAHKERMFESIGDFRLAVTERVLADEDRIDTCLDLCLSDDARQPLVFFWHTFGRDQLIEAFGKRGVEVQILDGEHPMSDIDTSRDTPILVQYRAGSEGVEFKRSNLTVFYENQFSFVDLVQARGRNCRRGGTSDIRQHYLISPTYYDQEIYERVNNHEELNEETLDQIAKESIGI